MKARIIQWAVPAQRAVESDERPGGRVSSAMNFVDKEH